MKPRKIACWVIGLVLVSISAMGLSWQMVPLFEKGKRPLQRVQASTASLEQPSEHPLSAKQCKRCHEGIYRQWQQSRHATAYTNRIFTVAFQHSPYRWCVHCHAPLPEQFVQVDPLTKDAAMHKSKPHPQIQATSYPTASRRVPHKMGAGNLDKSASVLFSLKQRSLLAEGINCAACHIREGRLLAANAPSAKSKKHHPNIRWDRRLKSAEFCAGCHEFSFTKALTEPTQTTGVLVQDTHQQWLHSFAKKKGKTCQSCHMSKGAHRFPGGHDLAFVRKALQIRVVLRNSFTVDVELRAKGVGHTIPTGDPFRRLRWEACIDATCRTVLATKTLHKMFARKHDTWAYFQDLRVPTPTTSATSRLAFSVTLSRPVQKMYWRLIYFYVEFPHHRFLPTSDVSQQLYAGEVQWPAIAPQRKEIYR